MDNSFTLARHFSRLVWLLMHESQAKKEQKAELRAVVLVAKRVSARLGRSEKNLAVNGLLMPQALAGVREIAERLEAHAIEEVVILQGAAAAELLTLARLLVVGSSTSSDAAEFTRMLTELNPETVRVRLREPSSEDSMRTADRPADAAVVTPEVRVERLLARLSSAPTPVMAAGVLDELAFTAAQASREGRIAAAVDLFATLIEHEASATDPALKRAYETTMRSLMRPTILRPVVALLVAEPEREGQVEKILERCGLDGVDVLVDQFSVAPTQAGRRACRDLIFRLPLAHRAFVRMLTDSRWHVVRQAADFLGELKSPEAAEPLARLLSARDDRVRRAAARALGRIESAVSIDALAGGVKDAASSVRLESVAALATRKDTRAGAALAAAIDQESDTEVQYAILAALGRVATPEAVQKLAGAAAGSGQFKQKKSVGLRVAAVLALRDARTAAALAALQSLAHDRENDVKQAVARVLSAPSAPSVHAR